MNKLHMFLKAHFKVVLTILIVLLSLVIYGRFYLNREIPIYESVEAIPLSEWLWALGFPILLFLSYTYASFIKVKDKTYLLALWTFIFGLFYATALLILMYGQIIYNIYVMEPLNPTPTELENYYRLLSENRILARQINSTGMTMVIIVSFVNSIGKIVINSRKEKTEEDKSLVSLV
jgi:hypothetical protein